MSKTRCAKTVPTRVAQAPLRPGIFRVSTATRVPETWGLTGDDARETLMQTGRLRLLKDAKLKVQAGERVKAGESVLAEL